jgi:hypothetical protein
MPAPTMGKVPTQPTSAPTGRRRRPLFLLLASALVVLATAIGTSVALANRPLDRQASDQGTVATNDQTPLDQAALDQAPLDQAPRDETPSLRPETPVKEEPTQDPASGAPADKTAVLADGRHDAYISKVDGDSVVVDVVQVFHDDAAVKAAIEDGKSRDEARYMTTHVRNQNPRLRTLRLADDLRILLRDA